MKCKQLKSGNFKSGDVWFEQYSDGTFDLIILGKTKYIFSNAHDEIGVVEMEQIYFAYKGIEECLVNYRKSEFWRKDVSQ